jgi:hypothetical protein
MSQWQTALVILGLIAWWLSPPASLGDLSRREALRRQMAPAAARHLSNQDVPPSPPGAGLPASSTSGTAGDVVSGADDGRPAIVVSERPEERAPAAHDEAWWRARIAAVRATLDHDQLLADAMQSRINALSTDIVNRDDPAQRGVLIEQRLRSVTELDRLKQAIEADGKAIRDIAEEARKQGVPPGWIR